MVGADREHWPGVVGVVNSLVANSAQRERLRITALAPAGLEPAFCAYLRCHGLSPSCAERPAGRAASGAAAEFAEGELLRVLGFAYAGPELKVRTKLTNLESPLNFARFYLASMLPASASKVLYLDADVVVQGDAAELSDQSLRHGELCAATLRKAALGDKGIASLRGAKLGRRFRDRYGIDLPLGEKGFNAGVFVFNLREWRALNLTAEAEHWISANNREKLYALGSQPPLTLAILGARRGRGAAAAPCGVASRLPGLHRRGSAQDARAAQGRQAAPLERPEQAVRDRRTEQEGAQGAVQALPGQGRQVQGRMTARLPMRDGGFMFRL